MGKIKNYILRKIELDKRLKKSEEKIYYLEEQDHIKDLAIKELINEKNAFHTKNLYLENENEKLKEETRELRKKNKKIEKEGIMRNE